MNKVLCVDASDKTIRCLEVEINKKDSKYLKAITFKTEFELGFTLPSPEQVVQFKTNLCNAGIEAKKVILFLHKPGIIHRNITIPILETKSILDYIKLNSSDFFPIGINNYIINATVIKKTKLDMSVSVYLVPKDIMMKCQQTLKMLSFKEISVSLEYMLSAKNSGMEESYLSISVLGSEINFEYIKDNQVIDARSEVLEDIENDILGGVVKFDDYLSSQHSASVHNLPIYLFADENSRSLIQKTLHNELGVSIINSNNLEEDNIFQEYAYLGQLDFYKKRSRLDQDYIKMLYDSGKAKEIALRLAGMSIGTLIVVAAVAIFCYMQSMKILEKQTQKYEELKVLQERYSNKPLSGEALSQEQLVYAVDTLNNHFFEIIEELKKQMPSSMIIESISIAKDSIDISVSLNSLEECSLALEKMDELVCSKPGEITKISQDENRYYFDIHLMYAPQMLD